MRFSKHKLYRSSILVNKFGIQEENNWKYIKDVEVNISLLSNTHLSQNPHFVDIKYVGISPYSGFSLRDRLDETYTVKEIVNMGRMYYLLLEEV